MSKNNKPLVIIGVILLNILVVFMTVQSITGLGNKAIDEARTYAEQDLCSKSIEKYQEVLAEKDTLNVRLEMIDVYERGLEISEITSIYNVNTFLEESIDKYSKSPKIYEAACDLMLKYNQYEDCAKILMQARDMGVKSDKIEEYRNTARYKYRKNYSMFSKVYPESYETYLVDSDGEFSFIKTDMSSLINQTYSNATSFSDQYAFVQTETEEEGVRSFIINQKGVRSCYFDDVTESTGVGMGKIKGTQSYLVACKSDETYKYYDITGKELFGDYTFAGRFKNDVAAVKNSDDTWSVINTEGKVVADGFDDVIINDNNECSSRGVIIAKKNGAYHLYDYKTLKQIGDFSCENAKPIVRGPFAFEKDGKWGYADLDGNVVLEPQYDDAKSFSNGLASVNNGGSWQCINQKGEIVIDESFEEIGDLSDSGILFVKTKGHWCYLQFYYVGE